VAEITATCRAELVLIGRAMLAGLATPLRAARALGAEVTRPY
jgi:hypothetical protein